VDGALQNAAERISPEPARKQDQEVIVKQMEQFFFGEGATRPAEYVPPAH